MRNTLPWLKMKITAFQKLVDLSERDVPQKPGIYVMQSDNTHYVYPWSESAGTSRVYYIGQATDLRRRLMTHKRHCLEVRTNPRNDYYWPYYEYAAYHGCNIAWIVTDEPAASEDKALVNFAKFYGAKPVANSQSRWE